MTWGDDLAAWWLGEVAGDPAYLEQVIPMACAVVDPVAGERWLDMGCGEGQTMRALSAKGASVVGCDVSLTLARRAGVDGPAVVARLPDLDWLRDDSLDGAYAVLVLEHLGEVRPLFEACRRVVRPGGGLAAVLNHPMMTAPGSAPVFDADDGEILWRWGDYLGSGATSEPAAEGEVTFHHRSMGALLNAAAGAGWSLQQVVEAGVGDAQAGRDPLLALQRGIPRLLGLRWQRRA
ncbi:MAG: class I SAM-dependent methyltransferase [Actinobacteria bacterium]|nr:class I SAM-dependent methyltransferase [Actinomycetota bacterium]MBU1866539.1 class I SAM-dependent methyltransferase [Actinomycetota bacterium]